MEVPQDCHLADITEELDQPTSKWIFLVLITDNYRSFFKYLLSTDSTAMEAHC